VRCTDSPEEEEDSALGTRTELKKGWGSRKKEEGNELMTVMLVNCQNGKT
jgi:hypothetical protein